MGSVLHTEAGGTHRTLRQDSCLVYLEVRSAPLPLHFLKLAPPTTILAADTTSHLLAINNHQMDTIDPHLDISNHHQDTIHQTVDTTHQTMGITHQTMDTTDQIMDITDHHPTTIRKLLYSIPIPHQAIKPQPQTMATRTHPRATGRATTTTHQP